MGETFFGFPHARPIKAECGDFLRDKEFGESSIGAAMFIREKSMAQNDTQVG